MRIAECKIKKGREGDVVIEQCGIRIAPACAEPLRRRQGVRNVVRDREVGRLGDGEIEQCGMRIADCGIKNPKPE